MRDILGCLVNSELFGEKGIQDSLLKWQAFIVPAAVGLLGWIKISNERIYKNLELYKTEVLVQKGILRALRGEVAVNLYSIERFMNEAEAGSFSVTTKMLDANQSRVGYLSARAFAMLNVVYSIIKPPKSSNATPPEYFKADEVMSAVGNLIAVAVFIDILNEVEPEIRWDRVGCEFPRRRVFLDPERLLDTRLNLFSDAEVEKFLSGFDGEAAQYFRSSYRTWMLRSS